MPDSRPKTPCVGLCSTVFGDSVCRGCMRFVHEVIDWNRYNPEQKQIIWQRLDEHLRVILPQFVKIYDAQKTIALLQQQGIPYHQYHLWRGIYSLLRLQDKGLIVLEDAGFTVKNDYHWNLLQQQLYELASAYYEKDFSRHF